MLLKNYKKLCINKGDFKKISFYLLIFFLKNEVIKMAFIKEAFSYDGIWSYDMGVMMVTQAEDVLEVPFGYNRQIIEEKVSHKTKPFFFGLDKEPLEFTISLMPLDTQWTRDKKLKIVNWLFKDVYKPFISEDNPDIIYYCMPIEEAHRFVNRIDQGFATITFRCNSPYAYSPTYFKTYISQQSSNPFEIENLSNIEKFNYPEVEVELLTGNSFKLINLTDGGNEFSFTDLQQGEKIYVNNESKQIISSLPNTYRLGNFNKHWLKLVQGVNRIRIEGDVNIQFRTVFPLSI